LIKKKRLSFLMRRYLHSWPALQLFIQSGVAAARTMKSMEPL
jgi:hypothetical protein